MEMLICKKCHETFDNIDDYTKHIIEYSNPISKSVKKDIEFETPLMRDFSKLLPAILLSMISFVVGFFLLVFPFSIREYCNNGIVTTSGSLVSMIISDLTGVCF